MKKLLIIMKALLKIVTTHSNEKDFDNDNASNGYSNFECNIFIDTFDIDIFLTTIDDPVLTNEHDNDDVLHEFIPTTNASE